MSIVIIGSLVAVLMQAQPALATYYYSGHRWSGTTLSFYLSDALPAAWKTQIAAAANTWTNAGSRFGFIRTFTSTAHFVWRENRPDDGALARTYMSWNGNGFLTDTDTYFNLRYTWSTSGEAGKYDVQNAAAHEFGHWLFLLDAYNNDPNHPENVFETMYAYIGTGETLKRSLSSGDIAGIKYIYGTP